MTVYMVFRVLGHKLRFQSRASAKSAEKAVQKLVDQQSRPPEIESVSSGDSADYIAVPKSNINRFSTKRRR